MQAIVDYREKKIFILHTNRQIDLEVNRYNLQAILTNINYSRKLQEHYSRKKVDVWRVILKVIMSRNMILVFFICPLNKKIPYEITLSNVKFDEIREKPDTQHCNEDCMNKFIIQTATILYQFGNIREYSTCL
jgi:hypothetical protein